jgi:hypothetical protein
MGFVVALDMPLSAGVAFLVCISCRNGRKRPFPGRFLDGFARRFPAFGGCRALPIGSAQRLRPAASSVSVGIPGPGGAVPVLMACGRDTVWTGYCAVFIFFIRFVDV